MQILAINRGDEQKILTVKMYMGEQAKNKIVTWLKRKWMPHHGAGISITIDGKTPQ